MDDRSRYQKMEELRRMVDDLDDAASLLNDELGEWWRSLAALYPMIIDFGSEEFIAVYEKELQAEHVRLKEEFRIEEISVTTTIKRRVLRDLAEEEG